MLIDNIKKMLEITYTLQEYMHKDIKDTKTANHDSLFGRNILKASKMDELISTQNAIKSQITDESELKEHKDILDTLELELMKLHSLNDELAKIVLPINELYKEIIDDISNSNGGNLLEVNA